MIFRVSKCGNDDDGGCRRERQIDEIKDEGEGYDEREDSKNTVILYFVFMLHLDITSVVNYFIVISKGIKKLWHRAIPTSLYSHMHFLLDFKISYLI